MARKRRGGDSSSLRVGGGSVNTSFRGDIGSSQRGDSNSLQAGGGLGQAVSATRGGGGGGSGGSNAAAQAAENARIAREAEALRQAEIRRQEELRIRGEQLKAQIEARRIEKLRQALVEQGRREQVQRLRDAQTGQIIQQSIIADKAIRNGKAVDTRIVTRKNLSTGVTTTRVFEKPKTGGSARLTGGVTENPVGVNVNNKEVTGTFEAAPKRDFIKRLPATLEALRKEKQQRLSNKKLALGTEVKIAGVIFLSAVTAYGESIVLLPKTIVEVVKRPSSLLEVPSAIARGGEKFGQLLYFNPDEALIKIGSEALLLKGTGTTLKVVGKVSKPVYSRINPFFKTVKKNKFGIQYIKGVKKVGNIEIIPPRGVKPQINIKKVLKTTDIKPQLKKVPSLPVKITPANRRVLKVVRRRGDTISGSFAQEAVLKKQFTRPHKDLDIITKNREGLMRDLKKEFGNDITFKKLGVSIEVRYKGKPIADLVEWAKGEGGFVRRFPRIKVNGINLVDPRARLGGKLNQIKFSKITPKGLKDIRQITGGTIDLNTPSITGAFGKSTKELRSYVGKRGAVITGQEDLLRNLRRGALDADIKIPKGKFNLARLKRDLALRMKGVELKKWLYATPADPKTGVGRVRVSRLGIGEKDAKFLDYILGEEIAFTRNKPQIFVFPDEKIFPKIGKLTKGKIEQTSKGFIVPEFSGELEVILGKGWLLKKGKTLTRTIISGRKVPIIELKKVRLSTTARQMLKDLQRERASFNKMLKEKGANTPKAREILRKKFNSFVSKQKRLNQRLLRESGIKYKVASNTKGARKVVRLRNVGSTLRVGRRTIKKTSSPVSRKKTSGKTRTKKVGSRGSKNKGSSRKTPSRTPTRGRTSRGISRISPSRKGGSGSGGSSGSSSKPPKRPSVKPPIRIKLKDYKRKTLSRKVDTYYVVEKVRGKFKKLYPKPLTSKDARDFAVYSIDNHLSKTAFLIPLGKRKQVVKAPKSIQGYYSSNKFKVRPYRIKYGKRRQLVNGWIEKRKYFQDRPLEKAQARRLRMNSGKSSVRKRNSPIPKTVRRVKRKITPAQRKVLIARLKKARAARMKNLKRKRR